MLPWEIARTCVEFHKKLKQTATKLQDGSLDPSYFCFFHKHGAGLLKEGKLEGTVTLVDHEDHGRSYSYELKLDSEHEDGNDGNRAASVEDALASVASEMGDLVAAFAALWQQGCRRCPCYVFVDGGVF